jgi:hypothetical protein
MQAAPRRKLNLVDIALQLKLPNKLLFQIPFFGGENLSAARNRYGGNGKAN